MFCPQCGAEFVAGIERCADCDVPLVTEPPPAEEGPGYETVLATSELALIPLVKSLLESAGIPYATRGESLAFPSEALGLYRRENPGQILVRVPGDRAAEARELLAAEAVPVETGEEELADPEDESG